MEVLEHSKIQSILNREEEVKEMGTEDSKEGGTSESRVVQVGDSQKGLAIVTPDPQQGEGGCKGDNRGWR